LNRSCHFAAAIQAIAQPSLKARQKQFNRKRFYPTANYCERADCERTTMKYFILLASIAICLAQVPTADVAAARTSKQAAEKAKNGADDKAHANWKPGEDCVSGSDFKTESQPLKKPGPAIVYGSNFVPAGGTTDFGLNKTFDEALIYFSFIKPKDKPGKALGRSDTASRAATDKDNLVTKDLLKKGDTIVSVTIPESVADRWKEADIYLYTCNKSPENISHASVMISPLTESIAFTALIMAVLYVLAARTRAGKNGPTFFKTLNPIRITAGSDGHGSLSIFQVFFFSIIVFVLVLYFLFRTGLLSDISTTVLTLLGIAGVGSTAAKGAAQSNGLAPENEAYLRGKGWYDGLDSKPKVAPRFYDLFMSEGVFDVYRYQCFIFSGVVGCALLFGGITQLSSFTIPASLLGILGLSQAVYVGGKLVTPTSASKLNPLVDQMRETEAKAHSRAAAPGGGAGPGPAAAAVAVAPQTAHDDYREKATAASHLFKNLTGLTVDREKLT
jgi:hypothetical protein